jgi:MFS superfamily sulfate permease-like transporter
MNFGRILYAINKALLFACISMYFGTGWSLVSFSFPIADQLTPANYYTHFVPQVTSATLFFTGMTKVMIVCCFILIVEEWKTRGKWFGVGILVAIVLATALTIVYIFPYNKRMADGINSQEELREVLHKWINLNIVRVSIWTIQWLLMMIYFLIYINATKKIGKNVI